MPVSRLTSVDVRQTNSIGVMTHEVGTIYGAALLTDTVADEANQLAALCVKLDFDTDEPERLAALVGSVKGQQDSK